MVRLIGLTTVMILFSGGVFASAVSYFGKGLYSTYETNVSDDEQFFLGGEFGFGYYWQNFRIDVGLGTGDLDNMEWSAFTRAIHSVALSDDSQIYAGAGVGYLSGSLNPQVSVGFNFNLSRSLMLDVGYQGLLDVANMGDVYTFAVGFIYRPNLNSSNYHPSSPNEQADEKMVSSFIKSTANNAQEKSDACLHVVRTGDYLLNIARNYKTDINSLLALNEKLLLNRNINLIYPGERINVKINSCN